MPKEIMVARVLGVGVLFVYFSQDHRTPCDAQKDVFQEVQAGGIFRPTKKSGKRVPLYPQALDSCKTGNSPGSCFELFTLLRKLNRDLASPPPACLAEFSILDQLKPSLSGGLELMVLLAWGAKPPEKGLQKFGWLETSDLALFCALKSNYVTIYGREEFEQLRKSIERKLPGEEFVYEAAVCKNCEARKSAVELLPPDEIWARSLFSLRCEQIL